MYLLVLAKSDKNQGWCIAGIEIVQGTGGFVTRRYNNKPVWVRILGNHENFEVTRDEAKYDNGEDVQVFDVVEVNAEKITRANCTRLASFAYPENLFAIQPENYMALDSVSNISNHIFRKVARYEITSGLFSFISENLLDEPELLYQNTDTSLTVDEAVRNNKSLIMIRVKDFVMRRKLKYRSTEYEKHYRASFSYNGNSYTDISVTDPDYEPENFTDMIPPKFPGDTFLLISVAGEFYREGMNAPKHFKIIGKVFSVAYKVNSKYHLTCDCLRLANYLEHLNQRNEQYQLVCDLRRNIEAENGVSLCETCERLLRPQQ